MSGEESIHVLHIDDNENDLYIFKHKLNEMDPSLSIDWARSSEEALKKLDEGNFDCLLADHEMPGGMNGLELLEILKQKGIDIPFIYLTGQGNEQIAAEAFRLGACDYYSKNFGFAYFYRIVNSIKQNVRNYRKALEQMKAEEVVKELNRERERILSSMKDVIWSMEIDQKGSKPPRYTYLSPAIEKVTGFSTKKFLDNPEFLQSRMHPDDVHNFIKAQSDITGGKSASIECRFKRKDGKYVWTMAKIVPEVDESGKIYRIQGITSDINAQKEAEISKQASEQKYLALFNIVPLMIIISTVKDGIFREVNDTVLSMTGFTKDEMIGKSVFELGIWANPSDRNAIVDEIIRKGYTKDLKMNLQLKNGQQVEVIIDALPITYSGEKCLMMIARTAQMKDESIDEFQKSEDRYRFLLMNTQEAVLVVDDSGKICDANPAVAEMLMYNRLSLFNKNLSEIVSVEYAGLMNRIFQSVDKEPVIISFKRSDGEKVESYVRTSVYHAHGSSFVQMIITRLEDDSEPVSTKSIYEFFENGILRNSPDIVYIKTDSGKLKAVNEKFAMLLNLAPEDLSEKSQEDILPPNISAQFKQSAKREAKTNNPAFFITNLGEPPNERAFHVIEFPLQKKDSDEALWCGIGREITDFFTQDDKVRRINAELDEFVHKVSHDLKAPIRNVIGYIEMAEDKGPEGKEYLKKAINQCTKLQLFISKLLELSKAGRTVGNFHSFDSKLLVMEVFDLFRNHYPGIELKIDSELPEVFADRISIMEVLQNLVLNALENSDKSKSAPYVKVSSNVTDKEIVFVVEDNGIGINKLYLDNIQRSSYNLYEKELKLHGFGLSISRRIIEAHGGRLWAESTEKEGSRFYFSIPKVPPEK
jgi:PAS domain S-box-containing protein